MLTVGQLKQIIIEHELSDDTPICLPYDSTDVASIDINVNVVSILDAQFSYSKEFRITLATSAKHAPEALTVRRLVGQNKWTTKILNLMRF